MAADNYEILKVLSKQNISKTFKTRHKSTNEMFVWSAVNYEHLDEVTRKGLHEKIMSRVALQHPNLLEFQNPIKEEESKSYYLVTKYCKNGSLKDMIRFCLKNNKWLTEAFLCKILYEVAFAFKTMDSYTGRLQLEEIFFDEGFKVKLYNFVLEDTNCTQQTMSMLGVLLFMSCTLEEDISDYEKKLKKLSKLYSKKLLLLIKSMMKDNRNLKDNIDKILCHPTVLLASAGWCKTQCFMQIDENISLDINQKDESSYLVKLKNLRSKEIALQMREQKLNEWDYRLANREKKIILMERTAKEKLQQAELYLKRCRESKSTSSSETSKYAAEGTNNIKYDSNLDSTYISVGDSIILPTSKKLNVNEIVKPAPFTRTLSERRIRFKGHSPLKDIDFNKKKTAKQPKKIKETKTDWLTCSEDNDRSSVEDRRKIINKKCKQLFPMPSPTYENDDLRIHKDSCEPIKWTEENKKNAFRLLRMMNNDKENKCDVKHTYL